MSDAIAFKLNDKPVRLNVDGDRLLLWVLRTDLGLTGTKFGCGEGHCGSCTVLLDGVAVRSCLQQAFMEHDALQCGFCTPGMVLTAVGLLTKNPTPTREQIIRGMEQNLCRCGAHTRIVDAIQTAAVEMKGGR
jgi:aerobic-type carbon monoxide dehydrogenase small subunit (CoxS/CutS family)